MKKDNPKDVIITSLIMMIATIFMLLAGYIISEYRIKPKEINIPGEVIEKPQVQQELIEIKKVEE